MVLSELKISRYQGKSFSSKRFKDKSLEIHKFYFGVEIENVKFNYLISKPSSKSSIAKFNNNFYAGYLIDNQICLLSIEGISIFEFNWKNRRDIVLSRNSNQYQKLEKYSKFKNYAGLEKTLSELI